AAVETAGVRGGHQLVLLRTGTYTLTSALSAVPANLRIAGAGATLTRVMPTTPHPGFRFIRWDVNHLLTLKRAAFDQFGQGDGGVVSANAGQIAVDACSFTENQSAGSGGVFFFLGVTATVSR